MKKTIKVISVFMMILMMGFILTGCSDKDDKKEEKVDLSAAAGTYKGVYTKFVGDATKNEEEVFSLELKDDGTGVSNREGTSYNLKWSLKGKEFKMTETFAGMSIDYNGTLDDGKLEIYNGDKDDDFTYMYVYEKQ